MWLYSKSAPEEIAQLAAQLDAQLAAQLAPQVCLGLGIQMDLLSLKAAAAQGRVSWTSKAWISY